MKSRKSLTYSLVAVTLLLLVAVAATIHMYSGDGFQVSHSERSGGDSAFFPSEDATRHKDDTPVVSERIESGEVSPGVGPARSNQSALEGEDSQSSHSMKSPGGATNERDLQASSRYPNGQASASRIVDTETASRADLILANEPNTLEVQRTLGGK